MRDWLLTVLILLPALGALAVAAHRFAPYRRGETHYRWIALAFSVATFALSLLLLDGSSGAASGDFRFVRDVPWIEAIGARYQSAWTASAVARDLTTLLGPSRAFSWTAWRSGRSPSSCSCSAESAMIGVFVSLDCSVLPLLEASLVPMFFLIGVWGGERRIYAAVKFFIYTAVGSLLMLAGILALYFIHAAQVPGGGTFDYTTLLSDLQSGRMALVLGGAATTTQALLFFAFALAFAIKVPLFPFHTWLPDAPTEAPTAATSSSRRAQQMGTYGRALNLRLPECRASSRPCTRSLVGIIYGALVAMVQPDVKRCATPLSPHVFVISAVLLPRRGAGRAYQCEHGVHRRSLPPRRMIYERRTRE